MTDNSDFMSRYLPPDHTEAHREHPGPTDHLTEEVSLTDLRLPEPGAPAATADAAGVEPRQFTPPAAEADRAEAGWPPEPGSASAAPDGTEGAHAAPEPPPPPPPGPPAPRPARAARRAPQRRAVAAGGADAGRGSSAASGPAAAAPAPIPPRPHFDATGAAAAAAVVTAAMDRRNDGHRGRTFALPARHPSGMSRSRKS